jgi:hypothetical protein
MMVCQIDATRKGEAGGEGSKGDGGGGGGQAMKRREPRKVRGEE